MPAIWFAVESVEGRRLWQKARRATGDSALWQIPEEFWVLGPPIMFKKSLSPEMRTFLQSNLIGIGHPNKDEVPLIIQQEHYELLPEFSEERPDYVYCPYIKETDRAKDTNI